MKRMTLTILVLTGILASAIVALGAETDDLAAPEQQAMSDTVQNALEYNKSNQSSDWVNPDTGNSGGVTPVKTFTNSQGLPCREFTSTIVIGGQQQQGYGTACRQPDGSWQIVNGENSAAQTPPPQTQTNIYVENPPPAYYSYPADFYYPYHIYLSFGLIYRSGYTYRGVYFQDGRSFRHRYPIRVRERVYITPHDRDRYVRQRGWLEYRERDRDRSHWKDRQRWEHRDRQDWRDNDRGDKSGRERGRGW